MSTAALHKVAAGASAMKSIVLGPLTKLSLQSAGVLCHYAVLEVRLS
jgi:hypothetical protein